MDKILHLFRISAFTEDFIRFINDNFGEDNHEFWIYGNRNNSNPIIKISLYKNVKYIHNILDKLNSKEIYEYRKIIYHGIFDQDIVEFFLE